MGVNKKGGFLPIAVRNAHFIQITKPREFHLLNSLYALWVDYVLASRDTEKAHLLLNPLYQEVSMCFSYLELFLQL